MDRLLQYGCDTHSCTPSVTWFVDGSHIVTASYDGYLRWHDIDNRKQVHEVYVPRDVSHGGGGGGGGNSLIVVKKPSHLPPAPPPDAENAWKRHDENLPGWGAQIISKKDRKNDGDSIFSVLNNRPSPAEWREKRQKNAAAAKQEESQKKQVAGAGGDGGKPSAASAAAAKANKIIQYATSSPKYRDADIFIPGTLPGREMKPKQGTKSLLYKETLFVDVGTDRSLQFLDNLVEYGHQGKKVVAINGAKMEWFVDKTPGRQEPTWMPADSKFNFAGKATMDSNGFLYLLCSMPGTNEYGIFVYNKKGGMVAQRLPGEDVYVRVSYIVPSTNEMDAGMFEAKFVFKELEYEAEEDEEDEGRSADEAHEYVETPEIQKERMRLLEQRRERETRLAKEKMRSSGRRQDDDVDFSDNDDDDDDDDADEEEDTEKRVMRRIQKAREEDEKRRMQAIRDANNMEYEKSWFAAQEKKKNLRFSKVVKKSVWAKKQPKKVISHRRVGSEASEYVFYRQLDDADPQQTAVYDEMIPFHDQIHLLRFSPWNSKGEKAYFWIEGFVAMDFAKDHAYYLMTNSEDGRNLLELVFGWDGLKAMRVGGTGPFYLINYFMPQPSLQEGVPKTWNQVYHMNMMDAEDESGAKTFMLDNSTMDRSSYTYMYACMAGSSLFEPAQLLHTGTLITQNEEDSEEIQEYKITILCEGKLSIDYMGFSHFDEGNKEAEEKHATQPTTIPEKEALAELDAEMRGRQQGTEDLMYCSRCNLPMIETGVNSRWLAKDDGAKKEPSSEESNGKNKKNKLSGRSAKQAEKARKEAEEEEEMEFEMARKKLQQQVETSDDAKSATEKIKQLKKSALPSEEYELTARRGIFENWVKDVLQKTGNKSESRYTQDFWEAAVHAAKQIFRQTTFERIYKGYDRWGALEKVYCMFLANEAVKDLEGPLALDVKTFAKETDNMLSSLEKMERTANTVVAHGRYVSQSAFAAAKQVLEKNSICKGKVMAESRDLQGFLEARRQEIYEKMLSYYSKIAQIVLLEHVLEETAKRLLPKALQDMQFKNYENAWKEVNKKSRQAVLKNMISENKENLDVCKGIAVEIEKLQNINETYWDQWRALMNGGRDALHSRHSKALENVQKAVEDCSKATAAYVKDVFEGYGDTKAMMDLDESLDEVGSDLGKLEQKYRGTLSVKSGVSLSKNNDEKIAAVGRMYDSILDEIAEAKGMTDHSMKQGALSDVKKHLDMFRKMVQVAMNVDFAKVLNQEVSEIFAEVKKFRQDKDKMDLQMVKNWQDYDKDANEAVNEMKPVVQKINELREMANREGTSNEDKHIFLAEVRALITKWRQLCTKALEIYQHSDLYKRKLANRQEDSEKQTAADKENAAAYKRSITVNLYDISWVRGAGCGEGAEMPEGALKEDGKDDEEADKNVGREPVAAADAASWYDSESSSDSDSDSARDSGTAGGKKDGGTRSGEAGGGNGIAAENEKEDKEKNRKYIAETRSRNLRRYEIAIRTKTKGGIFQRDTKHEMGFTVHHIVIKCKNEENYGYRIRKDEEASEEEKRRYKKMLLRSKGELRMPNARYAFVKEFGPKKESKVDADKQVEIRPYTWRLTSGYTRNSSTENSLECVKMSRSGEMLAVGTWSGHCLIYSSMLVPEPAKKQQLSGHHGGVMCVAWCPDDTRLATASTDTKVRVWDVSSGIPVAVLAVHEGFVQCVDWCPVTNRIASGGYVRGGSNISDAEVVVWDMHGWDELTDSEKENRYRKMPLIHGKKDVLGLAWSPDGRHLAVAGRDNLPTVLDCNKCVVHSWFPGYKPAHETKSHIHAIAWTYDGSSFLTGGSDRGVYEWNFPTGEMMFRVANAFQNQIWGMECSSEMRLVAVCSEDGFSKVLDFGGGGIGFDLKNEFKSRNPKRKDGVKRNGNFFKKDMSGQTKKQRKKNKKRRNRGGNRHGRNHGRSGAQFGNEDD